MKRAKKSKQKDESSDNVDVFDGIRVSCAYVASHSRYVRINPRGLKRYARELPLNEIESPTLDPERHYLGHGDDTLAYILILDSINFGSGYFPYLKKRPGMSGYFTVASSLTDYFRDRGPLTPTDLRDVRPDWCAEVFDQNLSVGPVYALMSLFAQALRHLGVYVLDRFDGSYQALVKSAGGSAAQLVHILAEMPFYRDAHNYRGKRILLFKRAQIMAADLSLAFNGQGPGQFEDLDRLTIFADNLVPHVLRMDGILRYDEELLRKIMEESPLHPGSEEEVEIRACAVHAVELIRAALHEQGHEVTSASLDYLLWNRGQQPEYKAAPRHRAGCVYY